MNPRDMLYPALCRHCGHLHDASKTESGPRYADCSTWRCPRCKVLIDDRPFQWGGSVTGREAVKMAELWGPTTRLRSEYYYMDRGGLGREEV